MHQCTQKDFGDDKLSIRFFKSWAGFLIFCPEHVNKDGKQLTLHGAKGMMRTSNIEFRVEKCYDSEFCAASTTLKPMLQHSVYIIIVCT